VAQLSHSGYTYYKEEEDRGKRKEEEEEGERGVPLTSPLNLDVVVGIGTCAPTV
jgi:hypothetical protein